MQWNDRILISGSASGVKTSKPLSFLVDSTGGSVSLSFGSSNHSFTVGTPSTQLGFSTTDLNAVSAGGAQASGVADKINTALNYYEDGRARSWVVHGSLDLQARFIDRSIHQHRSGLQPDHECQHSTGAGGGEQVCDPAADGYRDGGTG